MRPTEWKWPLLVLLLVIGGGIFGRFPPQSSADVATWVQAVGSIAAILTAFTIAERERRDAESERQLEIERRKESNLAVSRIIVEKIGNTAEELVTVAATIPRSLYSDAYAERLRDQRQSLEQVDLAELDRGYAIAMVAVRDLTGLLIAHVTIAPGLPENEGTSRFFVQSFQSTKTQIEARIRELNR